MWSHKFDKCVICGKSDSPHASRGLCRKCYQKETERKHKQHKKLPKLSSKILTKEFLTEHYEKKQLSLADIAKISGCTRAYIGRKIKEFGIKGRSFSAARIIALDREKIKHTKTDRDGEIRHVTYQKVVMDEYFFSYWSKEMAWILGVIFTDGNLSPGRRLDPKAKTTSASPRVTIGQKDPEILEKIRTLLHSNQKFYFTKRREYGDIVAGAIYHYEINNIQVYQDLLNIGLTPAKSMTMNFPKVPVEYLRHFIRGCWDGDGSILLDKKIGNIYASFVSGSRNFIDKMVELLKKELGIEKITIFTKGRSYYFKLHTKKCVKFCHFIYDGVPENILYSRKHNVFLDYLKKRNNVEKK